MKSADARVAAAPGGLSMAAAPSQAETNYKVSRTGVELICGTTESASAVALIGTVGKIHRGKPDGAAIALPQSPGVPVEFSGVTQDERGPPKAYKSLNFSLLKSDGLISGLRKIATPRCSFNVGEGEGE